MNWGARIILTFVLFAILIFTMVFISINQDINLVSTDYYKQEIEYEDQIQRERNTRTLTELPEVNFDNTERQVVVRFPEDLARSLKQGYVHLFRPSDSVLDERFELKLDNTGIQTISIVNDVKGLWKIRLFWEDNEQKYYFEKFLTYN